jgi:hypothetical protein
MCTKVDIFFIFGCDYYTLITKTHYYLKSMIKLGKLEDVRGTFDSILKWIRGHEFS